MGNMAGACLRLLQGLFRKEAITRASIGVRQYHQQSSLGENMDPVFQEFSWISRFAPVFAVNGDQVTILREPSEFYKTLKEKARHARNRIVLASLYLGTGELEQQLVDSIHEAAKNSTHSLHIQILLEYTRGSRGKHNSRTMLLPLLREYGSNVNISLYHSPDLRGMLKRFVPARLNEAIGLHHMKIYLFDDSLIISGANLENQYFTNRQDRYILLEDCPQVANFFTQLVSTVSGFSFQLHEDDSVSMKEDFGIHPFTGDIKMFKQEAERRVRSLLDAHQQFTKLTTTKLHNVSNIETVNKTNILPELRTRKVAGNAGSVCIDDIEERTIKKQETIHSTDSSNKLDTLIYPLIQMGPLGITNDEEATMYLLENSPCGSRIHLASGYFNLTESYIDIVLNKSKAFFNILSAAPQANGFFGAKGVAGNLPAAYTHISKHFYSRVCLSNQENRIKIFEYFRNCWTFHGKGDPLNEMTLTYFTSSFDDDPSYPTQGEHDHYVEQWTYVLLCLWYNLRNESLPSLTLLGSPNFGHRSVKRDLEVQLAVVTTNEGLRRQLYDEQKSLYGRSNNVTKETFEKPERYVKYWERIVTWFIWKHL